MLSGENGILTRASDVSEQTKKTSIEEQIKLAVTDAMLYSEDYTTIESETALKDALVRQEVTDAMVEAADDGYIVTVNGEKYSVTSKGVEVKNKTTIKFYEEISVNDYIEYTAEEGMTWGEFINSDYNVSGWNNSSFYAISGSGIKTIRYDSFTPCSIDDVIENEHYYFLDDGAPDFPIIGPIEPDEE